jgi:hypothetical protein
VKRFILFGLLGGLLATNTGCGLFQAVFCYRPCVARGDCMGGCGDICDDGCGPRCGPARPAYPPRVGRGYADCDTGCGCGTPCRRAPCRGCGACDSGCDPCADPCMSGCRSRTWHRGPLSCVFALFMPGCWSCSSCGERYWGDAYSDPPDCWDPCDRCGNYAGGNCSSCAGGWSGGQSGHTGGGCKSCNGGNAGGPSGAEMYSRSYGNSRGDYGTSVGREQIVSESERAVSPAARMSAQPHRAVRP